jgi:hypothetical protein
MKVDNTTGEVVSVMLRPLYLRGKIEQYQVNRKLGGPQRWPERFGEKEKSLDRCPGFERLANKKEKLG